MKIQNPPITIATPEHCEELLTYAQTQAVRMELSATTSCNVMESCIAHMFNEYDKLVQQKFHAYAHERWQ